MSDTITRTEAPIMVRGRTSKPIWTVRAYMSFALAAFSLTLGLTSFSVWAGSVGPLAGFGLMTSIMGIAALPLAFVALLMALTQGFKTASFRVLGPVIIGGLGMALSVVGMSWLIYSLLTVVVR